MSEKEDFVKITNPNDIQPLQVKEIQVDGESLCIVNLEGKYYAIGNIAGANNQKNIDKLILMVVSS